MNVHVTVEIGGLRLRNTEIERFEIHQEVGSHGRLELEVVRDRDTDLSLADLLAQPIQVTLESDDGSEVVFTGSVTTGTQSHLLNYGSRLVLEGATWSQHLQDHRNTRYFRNSTLEDIAGAMGAKVDRIASPTEPLNYVQDAETDFDFLCRVADDHGCLILTEGESVTIRRGFTDPVTTLVWGKDLLETKAKARPVNPGFKGAHFQDSEKKEHRFHGVRREPEWMSGALDLTDKVKELTGRVAGGGDPNVPESPGRTPTLADYKRFLERESERSVGSAVSVDCGSHNIHVRCGAQVDLQGSAAFDLPIAGQLGVTRVTHRFDGQQYSNEFTATPWAHFTCLIRPEPRRVPGVRTATVMDNVDPKSEGRVRLRYQWQDEEEVTGWAPVAPPYAGNLRGLLFIPEVEDKVLVAFEDGDPERPIVIGALWNGKDKAPSEEPTGDNPSVKKIVTRSGNTVRFVDDDGAESIEIFSARGDCTLKLANDDGGTPVITIHSEGDLSLEAAGQIRMSCESLVQRVGADSYREVGGSEQAEVTGETVVKAAAVRLEATNGEGVMKASGNAYLESTDGLAYVNASTVLMNPMGYTSPNVEAEDPGEEASTWEPQDTPEDAPGRTSGDAPTPRIAPQVMSPDAMSGTQV